MRSRLITVLVAVPLAAALTLAAGCGGAPEKKTPTSGGGTTPPTSSSGGSSAKKLEALESKGTGTVEGKIVYDGNPPAPKPIEITKDTDFCNKAPENEKTIQTWRVGADGGVSNVIVWVKAPPGKFFKFDLAKVKKPDVIIKQPFCAFEPHVFAMFPSYYDAEKKRQEPTGQKLIVENNAPITHNSNVTFGNPKLTSGKNQLLSPLKDNKPAEMDFTNIKTSSPTTAGGVESIDIKCNVHPWMGAYGRAFDHPFFAVTKDGKYKIENVPAGTELEVWYWHESMAEPKLAGKVKVEADKTAMVPEVKIK